MAYDNSNSGLLARNDRKTTDKHPDFTGQCEVGGVQYWISAWTKEGKPGSKMAGKKFFSLSFKPKDAPPSQPPRSPYEQPEGAPAPPAAPKPTEKQGTLDEEVPF